MIKRFLPYLLIFSLLLVLVSCGGNSSDTGTKDEEQDAEEVVETVEGDKEESKEIEWVSQLEQEKQEAEQLYSSDEAPEEKAAKAREKMSILEEEYTTIMDSTGETQSDYPLIRAYVDVRAMYVAIKHIAEGDEAEKYDSEYFQANNEATQILTDNYSN